MRGVVMCAAISGIAAEALTPIYESAQGGLLGMWK